MTGFFKMTLPIWLFVVAMASASEPSKFITTTTAPPSASQILIDPYSALQDAILPRDGSIHMLQKRCNSGDNSCGGNLCCPAPFSCIPANGATSCRIGGTQAPTFVTDLPVTPAYTAQATTSTSSTSAADSSSSPRTSSNGVSPSQSAAIISSIQASLQSQYAAGTGPTANPGAAYSSAVSSALATASANANTADGTSASPDGSTAKGHSISGGAIAGIVVGCIVGVALLALLVFFLVRRRRAGQKAVGGEMRDGAGDMYGGSNVGYKHAGGSGLPTGAATPFRQGKMEMPAGADGEPRSEVEGSIPDTGVAGTEANNSPAEYYHQEKDAGHLESGPAQTEKETPSGRVELAG